MMGALCATSGWLASSFMGGIIGNIAASLITEGGRWLSQPLLDKVPDLAKLLAGGGHDQNHHLLRALRCAECAALVAIIEECILAHSGIRIDERSVRKFVGTPLAARRDSTLRSLCRIRSAFRRLHREVASLPVRELARVHGAALQDVPGLIQGGMECLQVDEEAARRDKVVLTFIDVLTVAVTGPARFAALDSADLAPVAPEGLPPILREHLLRHPGGWWDSLRLAFRGELQKSENTAARTAWELDVQTHLRDQMGKTYHDMSRRLDHSATELAAQRGVLHLFREDFDRFSDRALITLEQLDANLTGLHSSLDGAHGKLDRLVEGQAAPQPRPVLTDWTTLEEVPGGASSYTPFIFASQTSRFLGRDPELTRLREFLHDDAPFRWWQLAGSGGQGKSRLALELVEEIKPQWDAGFLRRKDDFEDWTAWRPARPTLIVMDYVAEPARAQLLKNAIVELYSRGKEQTLRHKVRILAIERLPYDFSEESSESQKPAGSAHVAGGKGWAAELLRDAKEQPIVKPSAFCERALSLEALSVDTLCDIADSWRTQRGKPRLTDRGRSQLKTVLQAGSSDIADRRRPLIALLAAQGSADSEVVTEWSGIQALLSKALAQEREEYWGQSHPTDEQMNLALLATICETVSLTDEVPALKQDDNFYSAQTDADIQQVWKAVGWRVSGVTARQTTALAGRQPDLLGEFQALETLSGAEAAWKSGSRKRSHVEQLARAQRLMRDAWTLNIAAAWLFVDRLTQDFPGHPLVPALAACVPDSPDLSGAPSDVDPAQIESLKLAYFRLSAWVHVTVNSVGRLGQSEFASAHKLYELLAAQVERFDDADLREQQGKAAFNLVLDCKHRDDLVNARAVYEKLAALASQHDAPALRELHARAAGVLIVGYGDSGDVPAARALYETLVDLATRFDQPRLREEQARAARNLIVDYSKSKDVSSARQLYEALAASVAGHEQPALRMQLGEAALTLCSAYLAVQDFASGREVYDWLAELVRHHDEPALRGLQAKAALRVVTSLARAKEPAAARQAYQALVGLATRYREPGLLADRAIGAMTVVASYAITEDLNSAIELYREHAAEVTRYDEPAVREHQAIALSSLAAAYAKADELSLARSLYDSLVEIATRYDEVAFRAPQAAAAFNLIVRYQTNDEIPAARALFEDLVALTSRHDDPVLREHVARAATNLAVHYGNVGDMPAAVSLYQTVVALAAQHDESVLYEQQAKLATNLMTDYANTGDSSAALALYETVTALASVHDESAWHEKQARAAAALVHVYCKKGDLLSARGWLDFLSAFAQEHDEPEVRAALGRGAINLMNVLGDAQDLPGAHALYETIAALTSAQGTPEMRALHAKAAFNLSVDYLRAEDLPAALRLHQAIEAVAVDHEECALRELQAGLALNLITRFGSILEPPAARGLYEEISEFAARHASAVLRELKAEAARSLSLVYLAADDTAAAHALYEAIKPLVAEYNSPALHQNYATMAANLTIGYAKTGNAEAARKLYDEIASLATHYDEASLRESQGRMAATLVHMHGDAGQFSAALELHGALASLAAHNDHPVLREQLARATLNLVVDHARARDLDEAMVLYRDLVELIARHDEIALIEVQAKALAMLLAASHQLSDLHTAHAVYPDVYKVLRRNRQYSVWRPCGEATDFYLALLTSNPDTAPRAGPKFPPPCLLPDPIPLDPAPAIVPASFEQRLGFTGVGTHQHWGIAASAHARAALEPLIERVQRSGWAGSATCEVIRRPLPWYRGYELYELRSGSKQGFVLAAEETLLPLDGTSNVIHLLNQRALIPLTAQTAVEYIAYFCEFVRADAGRFLLCGSIDAIDWEHPPSEEVRASLSCMRPPSFVQVRDNGKSIEVKAFVLHGDTVYEAVYCVDRETGNVVMESDEPIATDLRVIRDQQRLADILPLGPLLLCDESALD